MFYLRFACSYLPLYNSQMIWFVNQMICLGSNDMSREAFHDPPEEDLGCSTQMLPYCHFYSAVLTCDFCLVPIQAFPTGIKFLEHGGSLAYTYVCSTLRGPGTE